MSVEDKITKIISEKLDVDISEVVNKAVSLKVREELLDKIDELSWEMGERNFGTREELYDRQKIFLLQYHSLSL